MVNINNIIARGRGIDPSRKAKPKKNSNSPALPGLQASATDSKQFDLGKADEPSRIPTNKQIIREVERKFEIKYDDFGKLLGLGNGKIEIRTDDVARKLFVDYKED